MPQKIDTQLFMSWLDFLKKSLNVNNTDAGFTSNIGVNRLRAIKHGRTIVKLEDFRKLAIAYPQLHDKAREIGIDPLAKTPEDIQHMNIDQMTAVSIDLLEDIRNQLVKKDAEIERLLRIIDNLTGK